MCESQRKTSNGQYTTLNSSVKRLILFQKAAMMSALKGKQSRSFVQGGIKKKNCGGIRCLGVPVGKWSEIGILYMKNIHQQVGGH